MKTASWMLTFLGGIVGGFTAWVEEVPGLQVHLMLPHAHIPGVVLAGAASGVAFLAVVAMWRGFRMLGGALAWISLAGGFFGADRLWTTAACILFIGGVLSWYEGPADSRR